MKDDNFIEFNSGEQSVYKLMENLDKKKINPYIFIQSKIKNNIFLALLKLSEESINNSNAMSFLNVFNYLFILI